MTFFAGVIVGAGSLLAAQCVLAWWLSRKGF